MEVTVTVWAVTVGLVVVLLALDLAVGALRPHAVGFREATAWSVFYIAVAIAFGVVFGAARRLGLRHASTSPATSSRRACRSTTCSSS